MRGFLSQLRDRIRRSIQGRRRLTSFDLEIEVQREERRIADDVFSRWAEAQGQLEGEVRELREDVPPEGMEGDL